ncbi:glycoprotein 3-alpha-L-fucosyltransferase A isoform X2 [Patella vulgata]|nr:glycoprotein 3-alpha-L-fucosyltransferase A isoform X2 [Patella vulgata]XP_050406734.2 glycoprotein 3-alpha-L-fucosyltransferase A isoform X2 [Patella vulgata]XP_050406735.2 glycoprotein 3-alpha-L-fucosyltransferase A isoform X2 [Patella vulgata]XP_055956816.1 glycoprotein 3-alpha-L-fucosyltransferase A isoform X2 [Patella vulgata]XP_055956817.1 glycoprotein 3-alpha-L-fucosyltransferase A isoform X2 [Patella vulgata]
MAGIYLNAVKKKKNIVVILICIILIYTLLKIAYFIPPYETERIRVINYRKPIKPWYLSDKKQFIMTAEDDETVVQPTSNITKHILWRNIASYDIDAFKSPDVLKKCKVKACKIHIDPIYQTICDAVVFYANGYPDESPPFRPLNQIWIFNTMESPYNNDLNAWTRHHWKNQINWTMTYRLDSDINLHYGNVRKASVPESVFSFENILLKKTKLVAWVVSHCNTPVFRENYAEELSKYIPVDIYGSCGDFNATKGDTLFKQIENEYKFYLSFENSHCLDYVTEKFFNIQGRNIVAVVRGAANYTEIYPPDTFIDVNNFKSPKELADFLLYLDKNNEAYSHYLYRKAQFKSLQKVQTLCQLCAILHQPLVKQNYHPDVYDWFTRGTCYLPSDVQLNFYQKLKRLFR